MRCLPILALAASITATTTATNLFVSDYNGKVTTLSLTEDANAYSLNQTHSNDGCGGSSSWLQLDAERHLLFCVDEGFSTKASVSSFTINDDGSLTKVSSLNSNLSGPVNSAYYGDDSRRALAVADYEGAAISTYKVSSSSYSSSSSSYSSSSTGGGELTFSERLQFNTSSSKPHQVVLDPTGKYLLVPDLGSDLVRVFSFDSQSLKLKALEPLIAAPGSGPRHLVFGRTMTTTTTTTTTTYMYLVGELAATVTSYAVSYNEDESGLSFRELGVQPTIGNQTTTSTPPPLRKNAPAEIRLSPDQRFLMVSNRNDTSFTLDNGNKSDSISTFAVPAHGNLENPTQLWPAGGSFPRSFEMNRAGDLVAVGLQNSQKVVIIARDVASGRLEETVAEIALAGNVTSVVWLE